MDELGFDALLHALVEVGGDTDTIASMAGQVAGARVGHASLPRDLVERLPERELVESTAFDLAVKLRP